MTIAPTRADRAALDRWIDDARAVSTLEVATERLGWQPSARLSGAREAVGPCPACGGTDRFSIVRRSGVWNCRHCGGGADGLALVARVRHLDLGRQEGFLAACEEIAGPAPTGAVVTDAQRAAWAAEAAAARARAEAERQAAEAAETDWRETERARAFALWRDAAPMADDGDTDAHRYLRHRGVRLPPSRAFRFAPAHEYWLAPEREGQRPRRLHTGPALLSAIVGPDRRFIGLHQTWIDTGLRTASGRPAIWHPDTGEALATKKVRGSHRGGAIVIAGDLARATRVVAGEGIETTGVVATRECDLRPETFAATLYLAGVALGNLGGPAADSLPHPTETFVTKAGATRRRFVDGAAPDFERPAMWTPEQATAALFLGDGDSDRFTTEMALTRACRRFTEGRPDRTARIAWAEPGKDFGDFR